MQAFNAILGWIFLFVAGFYIHALIRPKHKIYTKRFGDQVNRRHLSKYFISVIVVIFVLAGITAPPSNAAPQSPPTQQPAANKPAVQAPTIKEVTQTTAIPFATQTRDDPLLPKGQTSITQQGVDGQKTTVYEVTYSNGQETNRTLKSDTITVQPVDQIVSNGTYVAPAPQDSTPIGDQSTGDGYTNVDGNYVNSPSSNPAGATAQCVDGTYSYSQHHSGTCSHHGGVAQWL